MRKKYSRTIFKDENYFNNQSSKDEYDSDNESVMTFNSNTTSNINTTFTTSTTLLSKTGITGPLDNFAKQLREKILKDASENIIKSIEIKAKADLVSMTLTIDSEVFVWKAYDINTERNRMAEVKEKIKSLIKDVQDAGIKVAAIVTDSVSQYASARCAL
ncbi:unnamed protein product [Rhizophagus irregularis]|nr:unnamed protein product [Rhizophagus irregularis]